MEDSKVLVGNNRLEPGRGGDWGLSELYQALSLNFQFSLKKKKVVCLYPFYLQK